MSMLFICEFLFYLILNVTSCTSFIIAQGALYKAKAVGPLVAIETNNSEGAHCLEFFLEVRELQ